MSGELSEHQRREIAQRWADELTGTAYVPMSPEALVHNLAELIDTVVDAMADPTTIDKAGRSVGARLVALRAIGERSLPRSLELLRDTVFEAVDDDAHRRSLSLVSAIAAGYASADRESIFDQQETLKQAMMRSKLHAERQRQVSESHFHEVFDSTPIGVAISDLDGRFVEANPALLDTLGLRAEDLDTMTIQDLFHPEDVAYLTAAYTELAEDGGPRRLREQRRLVNSDGSTLETYLAVSVLRDGDGVPRHYVTMVEDISELHRLQESFQHQALHDVMTNLPNRQFFRTRLEAALANLPGEDMVTLYHLGLNGFELINDGLGYETGDSLIKAVARRLESLVDNLEGMVARFGGTEFAILVRETPETPHVAAFAAMINEELSEPVYVGAHGIATSASIGVMQALVAEAESAHMMWAADVALRRAEVAGPRQWALFDPQRAPDERTDARLAAVIPGALEMGEFEVMYRPIIAMQSGELAALEVMLRWDPGDRDPIEHQRCLRLAERSGVTLSLRDWVLRSTWDQLGEWHDAGYRPRLAIGLSHNQAQDPDLVASVHRILRDSRLDPDALWLSMPITAITGNRDEARENVGFLRDMGVRTSLHAFHGSPEEFRYLRNLPVHAVRLAPELIRIVHGSDDANAPEVQAVSRVVPLLSETDAWIVIGDIGSEEQARRWQGMGCRGAGVGSLFGEAIVADEVPALLERIPPVD